MTTTPVPTCTDDLLAEIEAVYMAGWRESGEGYNDEYPGDAHQFDDFKKKMRLVCEPIAARFHAAEKDAGRYRWLRDEATKIEEVAPLVIMVDHDCKPASGANFMSVRYGKDLDAAIDAAMEASK